MLMRKQFAFGGEKKQQVTKIIFIIDRAKITAVEYRFSDQQAILLGKPITRPWTKTSLVDTLNEICKDYNAKEVSILLGEDLAKVMSIQVDSDSDDVLDTATQKAALIFKDNFSNLGIDYAEILQESGTSWVQLFITKKSFLNFLGEVLRQLNLDVTSVEPLAHSLVSQLPATDKPSVVFWGDDYLLTTLVYQGKVIHAETLAGDNIYKQINSLLSWFTDTYSLDIKFVYMATKKLKSKKIKHKASVEEIELDPFSNVIKENSDFAIEPLIAEEVEPEDLKVEDETPKKSDIINKSEMAAPKPPLTLVDKEEDDAMDSVTTPPSGKSNAKLIAIIVTVIVVLVGMVVGGFFVYQNAMKEANESPDVIVNDDTTTQPTSLPSPDNDATGSSETDTDTDTETDAGDQLDPASISVQVLNGSGTAGVASRVANLLEDAGFEEIDTDNAESFDYEETVVQVKPGQDELYELVLTELQADYTIAQGEDLDVDNQFDLVITVGSN